MADKNMTVSIEEQEICINAMRDEKFATIYASDSTYITKLDRSSAARPTALRKRSTFSSQPAS